MKIRLAFEFDVNELNPMRRANQLYDIYEIQKFGKDLESNNSNYLQFAYFLKSNFFEILQDEEKIDSIELERFPDSIPPG